MDNSYQTSNSNKLNSSSTFCLMNGFVEKASLYPPAYINSPKQKREALIVKKSNEIYPHHLIFNQHLTDFGNSIVLIANDIAINHMVKESARFAFCLDVFHDKIKGANSVQELQAYYKEFSLKSKDIKNSLLSELDTYAELYNFQLDKKSLSELFDYEKIEFSFLHNVKNLKSLEELSNYFNKLKTKDLLNKDFLKDFSTNTEYFTFAVKQSELEKLFNV